MSDERWEPWWMPEGQRVASEWSTKPGWWHVMVDQQRRDAKKLEVINVAYGWEKDKKETTWSEVFAGCLTLLIQIGFILGLVWLAVKVIKWAWA